MSEHVVAERYEAAIRQVEGVVSCKVVLSDEGQIEEIHIMASTKRNPKQIVRDVETAWRPPILFFNYLLWKDGDLYESTAAAQPIYGHHNSCRSLCFRPSYY